MIRSDAVTIQRVDKRTFEKAFKNGDRVAIVKDPNYWKFGWDNQIGDTHEVPGPVGFTNAHLTLEDIYSDGPSRPGEAFRYWIVLAAPTPTNTETATGTLPPGVSQAIFTVSPPPEPIVYRRPE